MHLHWPSLDQDNSSFPYKNTSGTQHNVSYTKRVNGRYTELNQGAFALPWNPELLVGNTGLMVLELDLSPGSAVYHLSLNLSFSIFIKWESGPRWYFRSIPDWTQFYSWVILSVCRDWSWRGWKVLCVGLHVRMCTWECVQGERRCD
jgi:hypothetical protein